MNADRPGWECDAEYDAGDMACGDLVLELRAFFTPLASGTRVCVTARDPAAAIDIPYWCHLTGHRYVAKDPPRFLIERK